MTTRTRTVSLNNGVAMPTLGLGAFQVPDATAAEAVHMAFALWGSETRVLALTCRFTSRRGRRSGRLDDHAVVCDLRPDPAGTGTGGLPDARRGGQGHRTAGAAARGRRPASSGHSPVVGAGGSGAAGSLLAAAAQDPVGNLLRHRRPSCAGTANSWPTRGGTRVGGPHGPRPDARSGT
jgi:hypothetical protein